MGAKLGRAWTRRARERLLEHAAFATPRAIVLNLTTGLAVLALLPSDRLYLLPVRSIWENVFHVRPYSSGITRAMSRFLHGDLDGALAYNRLVIPVLAVVLALIGINAVRWFRQQGTGATQIPLPE